MLGSRIHAAGLAISMLLALYGCRGIRFTAEHAPVLVKDVTYGKLPPADTLVMGPGREIMVPDVRKDIPLIDGILDDPCWKKAASAKDFVLRRSDVQQVAKSLDPNAQPKDYPSLLGLKLNDEGDVLAAQQTEARLCYGKGAIYVAFDCADSNILAQAGKDGPVLEDDCVELLFDTHRNVFHIAVNPKAVAYTNRVISATEKPTGADRWHPGITVATAISDNAWRCEMAIPFASLEIKNPSEGSFCGLNLGRRDRPPTKHDTFEMEEISTWSAAGFNILEPRSEGIMFFGQGPPAMIAFVDPGQLGFGYNQAVIGIRNRRDAESKATLRLITFRSDSSIIESASKDLVLSPKETLMTTLNYNVPLDCESCSLDAALFCGDPETLIGHQELDLVLPKHIVSLDIDKNEYPRGAPTASARIELGVGEILLSHFTVSIILQDDRGEVSRQELSKLESRLITCNLNIGTLPPGHYTIALELREGAAVRGKTSTRFAIKS